MNTKKDQYNRLLHHFPIKVIKEFFKLKGKVEEVNADIVSGQNLEKKISDFAFASLCYTKQNIYLFQADKNIKSSVLKDFPFDIYYKSETQNLNKYLLLVPVTYSIYLSDPVETVTLKFLQPIMLEIRGKKIIVSCTKLKPNIKVHAGLTRNAKLAKIEQDEATTVDEIKAHFSAKLKVDVMDFNKGLKKLWQNDDIDCYKIQYDGEDMVTLHTMNGNRTFKKRHPKKYQELLQSPLQDSTWKYMPVDEKFCDTFTANATVGLIGITSSSKHPNQVANVIGTILANN